MNLYEVVKKHILKSIERNKHDKYKTARELDVTIKYLYNMLHEYGYYDNKDEELNKIGEK